MIVFVDFADLEASVSMILDIMLLIKLFYLLQSFYISLRETLPCKQEYSRCRSLVYSLLCK